MKRRDALDWYAELERLVPPGTYAIVTVETIRHIQDDARSAAYAEIRQKFARKWLNRTQSLTTTEVVT